jgi:hypothetical protein
VLCGNQSAVLGSGNSIHTTTLPGQNIRSYVNPLCIELSTCDIPTVNTHLNSVGKNVSKINETISRIAQSLTTSQLPTINRTLGTLSGGIKDLAAQVPAVNKTLGTISTDIKNLSASVSKRSGPTPTAPGKAESLLNVSQTISPTNVVIGQSATLSVSINNKAKNVTTIYSADLVNQYWVKQKILEKPFSLKSNRILYKDVQIHVPGNITAGLYSIETLVNSSAGDYIARTNLKVDRLQAIPFSGDIPLSVLVLVFSGAITYVSISYIITRKFERSYLELGLASVGFGFMNWIIASWLHLVGFVESINNAHLQVFYLIIVSFLSGLLIVSGIKILQRLVGLMTENG